MQLEIDKIKQISAYFAKNIDNLYVTKFLKLLYYMDFISVLERGNPVTNDVYYHLPYGPIPSFIKDQVILLKVENKEAQDIIFKDGDAIKNESFLEGIIELKNVEEDKYILHNQVEPDLQYLSDYEKGLIDDIIAQFKTTPTKEIVVKTHKEMPYTQTPENNIIDYRLAFYLDRSQILPSRTFEYKAELSQAEFFNNL